MRSGILVGLIVTVLCARVTAAQQPVQGSPGDILIIAAGDPNDPNAAVPRAGEDPNRTWDPATHVVATWESVTSMSRLYNPMEQPDGAVPERSLSIAARVDVIDVNGLIGFDWAATGTLVLDEMADALYSQPVPSRYCHFYWPLRYQKTMPTPGVWVSELQPYNLTVNVPMDPNRPYPLLLSRMEWSMFALVTTEVRTVDIPFRPTADWITLAPGLEIQVEEITAESTKYQYRIATRYSRDQVAWEASGAAISLWTHEPTPVVIVTKVDVLDPLGRSIQQQSSGSFGGGSGGSGSGDLVTGTASGTGSCDICGTATTFRFTLAVNPCQQELRFILENVPVPGS